VGNPLNIHNPTGIRQPKLTKPCDQCGKLMTSMPSHAVRYCSRPCMRLARLARSIATANNRFWPKVEKTSACWLWRGALANSGYGRVWFNRTMYQAHRVAYMLSNGQIPDGVDVCHRCDVKICVRPDHLFLGTRLDNMRDAATKGRVAKGSQHWTHRIPHRMNLSGLKGVRRTR
jgi:hypothetical protein